MSERKARRAAALLDTGWQRMQEGRLAQAQSLCEQALALEPRNADALHLLGFIALQSGEHERAVEWLSRAVAIRADRPEYRAHLAHALVGLKRYEEARAAFERAAQLDPGNPDFLLGAGSCLGIQGRPVEAEAVLRRLVERHPQYAAGWFNLGNAVKDQGRYEEASELFLRALQLEPSSVEAQRNLGYVLHKLGRFEEADQAFQNCLARKPDSAEVCVSRAITLNSLRRHAEAEALCRKALALAPDLANAWPILGRALVGQGRWEEALRCFEQAVEKFPNSPEAHGSLGDALARLGRVQEALQAFDRAVALGNAPPIVHFLKAIALFSLGRIAEGAAVYLGRHERATFSERHPDIALARELPGALHETRIALIGEQGIGDEIFFLRYAPLLRARGARLHYCGSAKIASLLARSPALDQVSSELSSARTADLAILIGDLPHLLAQSRSAQGNAPDVVPPPLALSPLPERLASVSAHLRALGPPPYIGLTWRAGTPAEEQRGHIWFLYKEIPLAALASCLRAVEGTLISLQRRPRAGETERLSALLGRPVHDLSAANEDLEEMAALLAVLDEYVGVSNTNMHLRAGVGKTARVLVPWPAEWRWMAAGEESPWFPGFRIYRQRPDGDWSEALARLTQELRSARGAQNR